MNHHGAYTARAYHEATKHHRGFVVPARRVDAALIPRQYKRYVDLPSFPLPPPGSPESTTFDIATLATFLHFTAGIIWRREVGGRTLEFRAASCTGALYHVEVYVVCGDIGEIAAGVYHYDVPTETLRPLRIGDHRPHLAAACADESIATDPASLVFTSTFWRNAWRYEERAYRHVFWDTGTMLANLLAMTGARDLDTQILTGFVDNDIATLLGLDTTREVPVCAVPIGTPTTGTPTSQASVAAHGHAASAPPDRLSIQTEPLSRAEIEYPLIWRTHEATNLGDSNAVTTWRHHGTRRHPLSSQARPEHGRRGEGTGGEVTLYPLPLADTPESIIVRRVSARRFKPEPVLRRQLDSLLLAATSPVPLDIDAAGLIRTHLLGHAVDGMPSGAFHLEHPDKLTALRHANLRTEAAALALDQPAAGDAAVNLYFTTSLSEIESVFGDRGYRVAQLTAGIRSGRLYLAATALNLRATGLTFYDDDVANVLSLDPQDTAVLMLMAIGQ